MVDSDDDGSSTKPDKNRRRALLYALVGAGIPLSQRVAGGKWITPVMDVIVLPAHAATSGAHPVGKFGSSHTASNNPGTSPFENIAERTEEEILDLFVNEARAVGGGCPTNFCSGGPATIDVQVVATILQNPSPSECVQATVTISNASCTSACLFFEFQAAVDGSAISISESCELALSGMKLSNGELKGNWDYTPSGTVTGNGTFSAVAPGDGCGSLVCP